MPNIALRMLFQGSAFTTNSKSRFSSQRPIISMMMSMVLLIANCSRSSSSIYLHPTMTKTWGPGFQIKRCRGLRISHLWSHRILRCSRPWTWVTSIKESSTIDMVVAGKRWTVELQKVFIMMTIKTKCTISKVERYHHEEKGNAAWWLCTRR